MDAAKKQHERKPERRGGEPQRLGDLLDLVLARYGLAPLKSPSAGGGNLEVHEFRESVNRPLRDAG